MKAKHDSIHISRRAAIVGAVAAAAVPTGALATERTVPIFAVIEAHRAAYVALGDAIDASSKIEGRRFAKVPYSKKAYQRAGAGRKQSR
jgi:hypothetical protein